MDDFLKTLKEKEKELASQLDGIRTTISLFDKDQRSNGLHSPAAAVSVPTSGAKIPETYDNEELTWKQKILFVINKLGHAMSSEIVSELERLGASTDHDFLVKRVSVMVSNMKTEGIIESKMIGNKGKYFIK